jgi:cytochrome c553
MQPVAAMLSEREIDALAAHYSAMPSAPPPTPAAELSAAQQAEAAAIASGNDADVRLPACLSCHGAGARADYPVLNGQQAAYIEQQLHLFQRGGRQASAWGEVMTVIAARLDANQIDLLARWFAQQAGPAAEQ